jgi:hypothetical protein
VLKLLASIVAAAWLVPAAVMACPLIDDPAPAKSAPDILRFDGWSGGPGVRQILLSAPLGQRRVEWRVRPGAGIKAVTSWLACLSTTLCDGPELHAVVGSDGFAHFARELGLDAEDVEISARGEGVATTITRRFDRKKRRITIEQLAFERPVSASTESPALLVSADVGSESPILYVDFTIRETHVDDILAADGHKDTALNKPRNLRSVRVLVDPESPYHFTLPVPAAPLDNYRYYQVTAQAVNAAGERAAKVEAKFEDEIYREQPLNITVAPTAVRLAVGEGVPLLVFGEYPANGLYPIWPRDPKLRVEPAAHGVVCAVPGGLIGDGLGRTIVNIHYLGLHEAVNVEVIPLVDRIAPEFKPFGSEGIVR